VVLFAGATQGTPTPSFQHHDALPSLYMCTEDMEDVLKLVTFAPRDLWLAYKEYCLGSYYKEEAARVQFFIF
jgi:hypothetical protein